VLGIRGEPGRPADAAHGEVWSSITMMVDQPGAENDYISVEELSRQRFAVHPWSVQGGAAPVVLERIRDMAHQVLSTAASAGRMATSGEDPAYEREASSHVAATQPVALGDAVRDWRVSEWKCHAWMYDASGRRLDFSALPDRLQRELWQAKPRLLARRLFGVPLPDTRLAWYEWRELRYDKWLVGPSIAFPLVATHNHFALLSAGTVCRDSAPVIKLPEGASEDDHLELLGLLNSSAACFWMKQVFHNKGRPGAEQTGANYRWEHRYEFDSTKLKEFPLPEGRPLELARALDEAAQRLGDVLPAAVAERTAPTRKMLDEAAAEATALRARMVALQEELDWACYHLYGLTDEELTFPVEDLPPLRVGERAFELVLARRGDPTGAFEKWLTWHGAVPVKEVPDHWANGYRLLLKRRQELIASDRALGLLERPEYKRRWYWGEPASLERDAQRTWLLDRIETLLSSADPNEPEVTTVARLADQLLRDDDARAVVEDLEGTHADPVDVVGQLVASAGVPYLAALRLKPSGLRTRQAWERTWELQRIEDDLDARAALPPDHPDHLDASALAVAKKEAGVDKIPVPPKYKSSDFRDQTSWRLRGKLDVPKERFVLYPRTHLGADTTAVVGWAGWDHLQQLRALAGLYTTRKHDGADVTELTPLLAGMVELLPWVLQWHDEPDPVYGDRMGQYFTGFVDSERAALGLTTDDLTGWRP
jgi:hypothetical protein